MNAYFVAQGSLSTTSYSVGPIILVSQATPISRKKLPLSRVHNLCPSGPSTILTVVLFATEERES